MIIEDKYMNNLNKIINNFLYLMMNNGLIIYNKYKIILIKIKNYLLVVM
jgi:hypothetical protein